MVRTYDLICRIFFCITLRESEFEKKIFFLGTLLGDLNL